MAEDHSREIVKENQGSDNYYSQPKVSKSNGGDGKTSSKSLDGETEDENSIEEEEPKTSSGKNEGRPSICKELTAVNSTESLDEIETGLKERLGLAFWTMLNNIKDLFHMSQPGINRFKSIRQTQESIDRMNTLIIVDENRKYIDSFNFRESDYWYILQRIDINSATTATTEPKQENPVEESNVDVAEN